MCAEYMCVESTDVCRVHVCGSTSVWRVQVCGEYRCVENTGVWRVQVCAEYRCVPSTGMWRVQVCGEYTLHLNINHGPRFKHGGANNCGFDVCCVLYW